MTVAPNDVVDAHLARLDSAACQQFVADLWAARGFETALDGACVTATRPGRSLVILPLVGRHPADSFPREIGTDTDVDVIVSFDGRARSAIADRTDARLLTPVDIREMLRYAVSPVDRERISRQHLGAVPSDLQPPLPLRVAAAAEGFQQRVGPLAVAVLTVLVVLVVATAGGSLDPLASSSAADFGVDDASQATGSNEVADAPGTATSTPTAPSPARVPPGTLANVPGVSYEGVTNLTALAVAHDRALGEQSYSLWTDRYRPENGIPDAPRTQRDTDIAVANGTYLVEESFERAGERSSGQRLVRVVYFDGADWYVDDRSGTQPTVRWIDGDASGISVSPDPRVLRRTLVTRYLDTPRTNVTERLDFGGTPRYQLEGNGRPPAFPPANVYNYSFVALVDDDGLVHEATVDFTVVTVEGSYRLRFEWTYGQFGTTTVRKPAWVDQARAPGVATETATATPSNRTARAA